MFKPQITLTFGKDRKKSTPVTETEPTPDYIAIAEQAATRLGVKLVLGTIGVVAATVVLTTVSTIATTAFENHTSK